MHGRIKVRTTEEQRLLKEKENHKKLIAYRAGVKQILSAYRNGNYNPQDLQLCSQILMSNPDIYTLWNYRKEAILDKAKTTSKNEIDHMEEPENEMEGTLIEFLDTELSLTEVCLKSNPKSYGSWHHRYWVLEQHPEPGWLKEFQLCTKYLLQDDRNFLCWNYRRLVLKKVVVALKDEIQFSLDRILENLSNYSSWHFRSTLIRLDEYSVDNELDVIKNAVFTDPTDSSPWFYFKWVLNSPAVTEEKRKELLDSLNQLQELDPDCKWIMIAMCWLTDSLKSVDNSDEKVELYKNLIKLDPMRKGRYEDYLKKAMEN